MHLLRHVVVVLDKVQDLLTMVKVGKVSFPMLGKGSAQTEDLLREGNFLICFYLCHRILNILMFLSKLS